MQRFLDYLRDSYLEMTQRVSWPSVAQLQASATVVLIASLIFATIIGGVDVVFKNGMLLVYESF